MQEITILKSGREFVKIKKLTDKHNGTTDAEIEYSEEFAEESKLRNIGKANALGLFVEEVIGKAAGNQDGYEIQQDSKESS